MGNIFNDDFRDFILALNNHEVEYILVGGFSVILHGYSRVTGDMDVWVERTELNYFKLLKAFNEFKMSIADMSKENFMNHPSWDVFKFGRKPVAIDIMTKIKGLDFNECFQTSEIKNIDGLIIRTLHINDLIKAKKASGRFKDLDDIDQLLKK